jgi:putative ABC transport system ATP-binding protein
MPAGSVSPRQWRARVGLLSSPPVYTGETLAEDLLSPWSLRVRRGLPAPAPEVLVRELEEVGLGELTLARQTRELSLGQLARVAFLRTVLAEPEVLLLDEPAANLDAASSQAVAERTFRFAAAGRAVLVAGHTAAWDGVHRRLRIQGEGLAEEAP